MNARLWAVVCLSWMVSACAAPPISEQRATGEAAASPTVPISEQLAIGEATPSPASPTSQPRPIGEAADAQGCVRTTDEGPEPEATDLEDDVTHYGIVRQCADGRPAILTIDPVEYYAGEQAVREAAKDGQTLERDVDPVEYVRNPDPRLRRLGVKPDANVLMFDCSLPGCAPKRAHLDELPWNSLYRFQLQDGLIVYIELPYSP